MTPDDRPTAGETPEDEKWPVSFLVIVGLAALYMAWRMIQAVGWILQQI